MRPASATVPHPLREDAEGVIRIGYPALTLEQIYATISCFLGHEADLRAYIDEERAASAEERRRTEANPEIARLRERLPGRRETP